MTAKNRNRRSRTGVVGLIAAGSLLATSCGGGDAAGDAGVDAGERDLAAMADFGAGDSFVATEPLELSVLYRNNPDHGLDDEWMFFEHLEENHNVSLSIVDAPLSDFEQRRSLVIGAGDMPDFVPVTYPGQRCPTSLAGRCCR